MYYSNFFPTGDKNRGAEIFSQPLLQITARANGESPKAVLVEKRGDKIVLAGLDGIVMRRASFNHLRAF